MDEVEQQMIIDLEEQQLVLELEQEAERIRNKQTYTIENLFIELAQKEHTDIYDLSSDILTVLKDKQMTSLSDFGLIVNELNDLIYKINNKKFEENDVCKGFKIEKSIGRLVLIKK